MYYGSYRLPFGEKMLSEAAIGLDELDRRITVRVETCNGVAANYERMLSYKDNDQQVVKLCSYGVPGRQTSYLRVMIMRGTSIEHTARGDWRHKNLTQLFRSEDFQAFTSAIDAMAYAQSWIRNNIVVREAVEAML